MPQENTQADGSTAEHEGMQGESKSRESQMGESAQADGQPSVTSQTDTEQEGLSQVRTVEKGGTQFETLTIGYERLRHSHDPQELSSFARRTLPDRSDQSAFSRATALLEAVAGNPNTPVQDRVFLAQTMPFPNVLVKLSVDPSAQVRQAVASNTSDKNWLVGRLTKDPAAQVRDAALHNPQTSWKMRLEGAENARTGVETLDYLSRLGTEIATDAPQVLAIMVRHAVARNPQADDATLRRLADDPSGEVSNAARGQIRSRGQSVEA